MSQLKHELAQARAAQRGAEESLASCKSSLEEAHALILTGQQTLDEELASNVQLQQELEEAQRKLGDASYLADAIRRTPAFAAIEQRSMRRGVIWTLKKFRAKYPSLLDDNFLPLFDALCTKMRPTTQGASDGGHPPAGGIAGGAEAQPTGAGPSHLGACSSRLSSRRRGPRAG